MPANFIGEGWNFPVVCDPQRQIAPSDSDQSVFQAIWLILGTAKGERVMRPDFGCGIHALVFADNSAATAAQVAAEVKRALLQWEPRIDVLDVEVTQENSESNVLLIEIRYRVRQSNNVFNIVYPFYLEARPT